MTEVPQDLKDMLIRSQGLVDVVKERVRQIKEEGWTPEHDDTHTDGAMAAAAATYAYYSSLGEKRQQATQYVSGMISILHQIWPASWAWKWWKPKPDLRRNLVVAGALILAEIERIDRAKERDDDAG